jgi:DNA-binding beta-propeller fold protein YncE
MRTHRALLSSLFFALVASATAGQDLYTLSGRIASDAGGAWDYAIIDAANGRLYLAQSGVTAVDLKTAAVTPRLVTAKMSHGLALLDDGAIAVDDAVAEVITVFEGSTGKILSTIATARYTKVPGTHALDALVREPKSGLLIAVDGESGQLLMVDVRQSRVLGTIALHGKPEFAVADGTGKLLVNVNHGRRSEIVTVDVGRHALVKRVALAGCEGATGLAYDEADRLVMSVCDNGWFKVIDLQTDRPVASLAVGRGADAVMFDPTRRRAFVAAGESGTLSVIAVRGAHDIALLQTLSTRVGTRLGAVDPVSGRLYLPAARFGPPKPPLPYPTVLPGSFEFLIASPR